MGSSEVFKSAIAKTKLESLHTDPLETALIDYYTYHTQIFFLKNKFEAV